MVVVVPEPVDDVEPEVSAGSIETVHHCVLLMGVAEPVDVEPAVEVLVPAGGVVCVVVDPVTVGWTLIVG